MAQAILAQVAIFAQVRSVATAVTEPTAQVTMEVAAGLPEATSAGAAGTTASGAARRRRAQRQRQSAKQVGWLLNMVQGSRSHHTAVPPFMSDIVAEVTSLRALAGRHTALLEVAAAVQVQVSTLLARMDDMQAQVTNIAHLVVAEPGCDADVKEQCKQEGVAGISSESQAAGMASAVGFEEASDRPGGQVELDETNQYLTKPEGQCLAKAETFSEIVAKDQDVGYKTNETKELLTNDQDVKYKTNESDGLDKFSDELSSDRPGVQVELDGTNEYLTKPDGQYIAKAETYPEIITKDQDVRYKTHESKGFGHRHQGECEVQVR